MRGKISGLIRENKGSLKEPPFAFKMSVLAVFIFLILGSAFSETGEGSSDYLQYRTSERLSLNRADIFSRSRTALLDESPDLLIVQGNTIYASTPLHLPKIQILGAQSFFDQKEKDIISYTVRSGDSLDLIASRFGISQKTIIWTNNLKGATIRPGQELIILPVSGVFHIVEPGDTVERIANKYKAQSKDIIEFNELESEEEIGPGDILLVPGGRIREPVIVAAPRVTASSSWLIPPTSGYISQRLHWYNAVDIANSCGTPVYASAAGTVQRIGHHSVAGNYVRIIHSNGVVTFYGHLSGVSVSRGQAVAQGVVIGSIGNSGHTVGPTGCHLHFEVRGAANPFAAYSLGHRF